MFLISTLNISYIIYFTFYRSFLKKSNQWQGSTHKNVRFRSPDRLTTQSEKSPNLPVGWSTLLPLGSPFWILAGTCHMVHRRWTQMIKDGQCLQIKVFSCNIRYEICKKWGSWLVPSFSCKRRINSKGIYIKYFIKMLYLSYPRHHLFVGLHLLLLLQDLTQFERLSQNLQVLTD